MQLRTKAAMAVGILAINLGAGYGVSVAQVHQPHMQNAMADLQAAKAELVAAEADKGGHRVNAINLVNQAIYQVNQGIAYAY
ncbi:MAG TPA: hypothetical protein VGI95_06630 [Caulobacteraceae bacterium]|jgi:hypothetical protein